MKLTRLRLTGFKSFVEPTDFLIEPGLTGEGDGAEGVGDVEGAGDRDARLDPAAVRCDHREP